VQAFGRAGARNINVVGADNLQGGGLAGDLLTERGYRKIAFLGGPMAATSTEDRLSGFRKSLKKHGLAPAAIVYGASYSHESGLEQMKLLLDKDIDAVFCGDDILAIGAMDACREARVDVPKDLGIVGFNDLAMAAWPAYRLTTIRQPIRDIIVSAVDLVLSIVDEPDRPAEVRLFSCEVVDRGTLRQAKARRKAR
jgi:DNA-binding LacI/PurR family transcriptional regulator